MRDPRLHCPLTVAVKAISGKWKLYILSMLSDGTPKRYTELLKSTCENLTEKMLTSQLRELEKDGIITRKVYPEVPPRVEYMLTASGKKLCAIFEPLYEWGMEYMKNQRHEKLPWLEMGLRELS
ncbi:DNA-binding transcriptional regulator, HxlR family [Chitinophaga eiseniae]|uniref:DNA-binding transcriptional regulator, HxlR family n=1 Tax=Chitinophaga eiseniae TaxID=634771 RepID=A0A1T4TCT9_9BACT|nr:helix-turn-helix domain-containing protein [Chitinophaga eiseniae]SKA37968.1 DNA-binding transcriptional regulator, HxlR family [Chitinophaga eiseniae]